MTQPHVCNDPAFLANMDGIGALPDLLRLLAAGDPVDLDELIEVAGVAGADLARAVRAHPGAEWESDGRLAGFGITLRPTENRFIVGGRTLYTWCASDVLFFTVILGEPTVAESRCPATGEAICLELTADAVTSVTPKDTVVSQRHRLFLVDNLRSDICDHGHFFASPNAAAGWLSANLDGRAPSVTEVFAECRAACEELGWLSTEAAGP